MLYAKQAMNVNIETVFNAYYERKRTSWLLLPLLINQMQLSDDVPKPSFPFSLLKPSGDKSNAAAASTTAATNNTTDQQRNDQTNNTVVSSNNVATVNNNNKPEPENKPSIPQPISQVNSNSINSNNNQQPSNQAPPKINNSNSSKLKIIYIRLFGIEV